MDTQLHLRMKNIISHYENRIKETRQSLITERDPQIKGYLLGLIDGFQFMIVAMKVDLMRFNNDPTLEQCQKHKVHFTELWEHEYACPECHYEAFHYSNEGVN